MFVKKQKVQPDLERLTMQLPYLMVKVISTNGRKAKVTHFLSSDAPAIVTTTQPQSIVNLRARLFDLSGLLKNQNDQSVDLFSLILFIPPTSWY